MVDEDIEILKNRHRKKIIMEFIRAQNELDYEYVKSFLKHDTTRPDYHLSELVDAGLLERTIRRGFYKLSEKNVQTLRNKFNIITPICLVGGLAQVDLFVGVLKAYEEQYSISPKKYVIITSPEIHDQFNQLEKQKYKHIQVEIVELDYQSVLRENYLKVYEVAETQIKQAIHQFEVICEITGGTKPVSLALNNLSIIYSLRKSYYSGRKIIWI